MYQDNVAGNTPPPEKKSSWMKWIAACGCGCLLVLGLAVVAVSFFFTTAQKVYKETVTRGDTVEKKFSNEDGGMKVFVNSPKKLDGALAEHYVDFTFKYPKHWAADPGAGVLGAENFAKVENAVDNFTHENFAVGCATGDLKNDKLCSQLVNDFAKKNQKLFDGYKKLGEGPCKFGKNRGYEIRIGYAQNTQEKGLVKLWMRAVIVRNEHDDNGVFVIMLATNVDTGINAIEDVGIKGELPQIINSFEFK